MKLLTTILCILVPNMAFADLWFSRMENGDRVEATVQSTGCFHDTTNYYEVRRTADGFSFAEYEIEWDAEILRRVSRKTEVGRVALSAADVAALDMLLRFYRGKKTVSSTTQVKLNLQFYEPEGLVAIERLEDGSGGYGLSERSDTLTFYELTKRFSEEEIGPHGRESTPVRPAVEPAPSEAVEPG